MVARTSLNKEDLLQGLMDLGEEIEKAGRIVDLCVYGGSCLMLVSNFRDASQDVDAVAIEDQPFIDRIARLIATKRNWPQDWLNDGVRTYLSPNVDAPDDHEITRTYPSEERPALRVYVPSSRYMLAMKLMALRIDDVTGQKDTSDILNLIQVVGIRTKTDLVASRQTTIRKPGSVLNCLCPPITL